MSDRICHPVVLIGALLAACPALGHDIYDGVRSPTGQLCCGGDPSDR